jgi:integrase
MFDMEETVMARRARNIYKRKDGRWEGRYKKNGGKSGQGLSGSTVSEVVSVMAGLRGYALRHGYSVVFTTDCVSIRQQRGDIRVFSIEEEDRLVSWLLSHMDETALGVYTALFTGIRIGELCAMTWDYIDMEAKTMRIGHTMQRIRSNTSDGKKTEVKIFEPKSIHSLRTIPLPNCLIPLFMSYHVPGHLCLPEKRINL